MIFKKFHEMVFMEQATPAFGFKTTVGSLYLGIMQTRYNLSLCTMNLLTHWLIWMTPVEISHPVCLPKLWVLHWQPVIERWINYLVRNQLHTAWGALWFIFCTTIKKNGAWLHWDQKCEVLWRQWSWAEPHWARNTFGGMSDPPQHLLSQQTELLQN